MNAIAIPAHFDGEKILLDKPYKLQRDMKLTVLVLPENSDEDIPSYWLNFLKGLDMFTSDFMETREDFTPKQREEIFS